MRFGSAWYPEQWPEEAWERDLTLMREAGMDTVRLGEFAWSRLEPAPGQFALDWLERAIDRAAAHGLSSVIGTPTAAPPSWLTRQYPEVLTVLPDGQVKGHGTRTQFDPSSPCYLEFCARIATVLAERFGDHPSVIGWQVDNEFGDVSYSDASRRRFIAWLQRRYGSLEELNRRWGTAVWSLEYSDWTDIRLMGRKHTCLAMAVVEWRSLVWREYLRVQAEAIAAHRRRPQFITHNFTYEYARQDPEVLADYLDLAGVDPYVGKAPRLNPATMGLYLAVTRGVKRKPFWVMETQPGFTSWGPPNAPLPPGEVRRMVYHQVGQGADAVLFWQWRASRTGFEQYHGTIVHASGEPRPLYAEIARTGAELAQLRPLLEESRVETPVAVLWNHADRMMLDLHRHHPDFDPWLHLSHHFAALRRLGLDVDVIDPAGGIAGYRLLVAPALHRVDGALLDRLLAWVTEGGYLLLGPRSGFANPEGAVLAEPQPGARLTAAVGAHVEEWYALAEPVSLAGEAGTGTARIWGERLSPETSEGRVLLRFGADHGWLAGQAAYVERDYGRGRIGYLGAWPDDALLTAIGARACGIAQVATPWAPLPPGVELSTRIGPRGTVHILCNHSDAPAQLHAPSPLRCAFTGEAMQEIHMAAGDVGVFVAV